MTSSFGKTQNETYMYLIHFQAQMDVEEACASRDPAGSLFAGKSPHKGQINFNPSTAK